MEITMQFISIIVINFTDGFLSLYLLKMFQIVIVFNRFFLLSQMLDKSNLQEEIFILALSFRDGSQWLPCSVASRPMVRQTHHKGKSVQEVVATQLMTKYTIVRQCLSDTVSSSRSCFHIYSTSSSIHLLNPSIDWVVYQSRAIIN